MNCCSRFLEYINVRDVYTVLWNLNSRFNNLLATIDHLELIIEREENENTIALLAPHIRRLLVNTWDAIDLHEFCNFQSLTLMHPLPIQLKQIRPETMPKLTRLSLGSNMYLSLPKQLIDDVFSNRFPCLRWAWLGRIDTFDPFYSFQSSSLRYLHIDCYHPTMISFILTWCPNLNHLHIDFSKPGDPIKLSPLLISNHPLRQFILRDYCCLVSYEDISTIITYIPNLEQIELKFSCNVPFISLLRYLSNQLSHLKQFNCDITEYPIDSTTRLAIIRQVHPCFGLIACRTEGVDFRIFHSQS